jgi:hypothetical protein
MVALYFMHYNFCRVHKTLRVTPAMEAGKEWKQGAQCKHAVFIAALRLVTLTLREKESSEHEQWLWPVRSISTAIGSLPMVLP